MTDISLTSAVSGVSSEGFIMTVHPAARAGAVFQDLASLSLGYWPPINSILTTFV